jgi:hypothetical protein
MPSVTFDYDRIFFYGGTDPGNLQHGVQFPVSLPVGGGGTVSNPAIASWHAIKLPSGLETTDFTVDAGIGTTARAFKLLLTPGDLGGDTDAVLVRVRARFDVAAPSGGLSQLSLKVGFTLPKADKELGTILLMDGEDAVHIDVAEVSSTSASLDPTSVPYPSTSTGTGLVGAAQTLVDPAAGTADVQIPVEVVPSDSFPPLDFMTVIINLVVNFPHGRPSDEGRSGRAAV